MLIDNIQLINEFRNLLSNLYIQVFVFVVLLDIATGIAKSFASKKTNSTKGLSGLIKHLLVVVLVLVVYPYMRLLDFNGFAAAFVFFYIAAYGISIVENLDALGMPFPQFIKERLEKIKESSNKGES